MKRSSRFFSLVSLISVAGTMACAEQATNPTGVTQTESPVAGEPPTTAGDPVVGGTIDPIPSFKSTLVCTDPSFKAELASEFDPHLIPALEYPSAVDAAEAPLESTDRVLGVVVDGVARAYPLIMMWNHEIANDTLAGRPLLVSYCPLTGSGVVFDRRFDGKERMFGASGMLFENNLVMYDHENKSLWTQMMLGSQCGPDRGKGLTRIPVMETTWGDWKTMYPQTRVATAGTPNRTAFGPYPYGDYAELNNATTIYPSSSFSGERPPKELVLGVFNGSQSLAYPLGELEEAGDRVAINERLGSKSFVVVYSAEHNSARAFNRNIGGQSLTFESVGSGPGHMTDTKTGSTWDRAGRAISGPLAGESLSQMEDSYTVFWFAWNVYYPTSEVLAVASQD